MKIFVWDATIKLNINRKINRKRLQSIFVLF